MRKDWSHLEKHRIRDGLYTSLPQDHFGAFQFRRGSHFFRIIATDGEETGWEHVSLSMGYESGGKIKGRMPTWEDMCLVKEMFWEDEETVMQLHPPKSQWVNNHANCLHLWRPTHIEIPLPPSVFVGDARLGCLAK
jgi:hypothetical protein